MISAAIPENEAKRLRALEELEILDTIEEQAYDDLTFLAAQICQTPIALISLIDEERQWFKSHYGLDVRETPRELAFCAHAILDDKLFIVEDSLLDKRFHDNPLATDEPHVKFYAGAPLIVNSGARLGTLCVIDSKARSITPQQQKALQALARQVVSQLELRLKVKELQVLDQAKDEFISMVNHELRTPLTSIAGSLDLLKAQPDELSSDAKQMINIAHKNAGLLINIVNDILDLASIEAGKLNFDLEPINLVKLVEQTIALNLSYCQQCGCDIKFKPLHSNNSIMVCIDQRRIIQALSNLISNAVKFTHDGDTVEVSLSVSNGIARVDVTDHGVGIPVKEQALLFKKFQRLGSNGNQKLPGTGLGLNISKHLVEMQKGRIGFESIPNKQTTFYITLPILADDKLSGS